MSKLHASSEAALLPDALPVFADLTARHLTHRWALSVRSSQAFALNLFAPLTDSGVQRVFGALGVGVVTVDLPIFEWSDPTNRLAEGREGGHHLTQIDVLLRGVSDGGGKVVALVEVKFTESDFGWCSAYENRANPQRHVCHSPGLFGGQPEHCFQLSNHGHGRRRYDTYLAEIPVTDPSPVADDGGCVVRRGLSQPMRSLALAHMLIHEHEADLAIYAVCAPAAHPTIWRRLHEVQATFPDTGERITRAITAEQIGALHADGGKALSLRYRASELAWNLAPRGD